MSPQKRERVFIAPSRRELLCGLIYLPLHMFLVGELIYFVALLAGIDLTLVALNLIYMLVGTLYLMLTMSRYLKASFAPFRAFGASHLWLLPAGWGMRLLLGLPIGIVIVALTPELVSPNEEIVREILAQSFLPAAFMAIVLAPIVEEILFRALLFASIRKKSRFLAYAVSTILFALLHIVAFLFFAFSPDLFIVMLLYIPAGIALCWAYERSGSIWTPIALHAFMNLVAVLLGPLLGL